MFILIPMQAHKCPLAFMNLERAENALDDACIAIRISDVLKAKNVGFKKCR